MRMRWHDLCFLHWRADATALERRLPTGVTLDTFAGEAWIAVVPFRMTDVSLRATPRVRRFADFSELNVRTYVTAGGKPGVWFFSLDATQPTAVRIARRWLKLPYLDARIDTRDEGDAVAYTSVRTHAGEAPAELTVRYRPTGPSVRSAPGTLEHFLTERYCLYAPDGPRGARRIDIDHAPWPLQPAEVELRRCTMTDPLGFSFGDEPPLAHFAKRLDVVAWLPRRA
jgi:uncharacterized protein YqjF (DUF2071 family)